MITTVTKKNYKRILATYHKRDISVVLEAMIFAINELMKVK